MKKITYKERAMFYTQEVKKNYKNVKLLNIIKNKYNINYAVLCPCASGLYFEEFSKLFKQSYFIDIEKNMIDFIDEQNKAKHVKNIKTYICDIKDINKLKIKCDCIFVLDQGMQYLNYFEFKTFLDNSYLVSEYIVLDLFDFNSGKKLTYYDSEIEDNKFYFSKKFTFKKLDVQRYNKHIHHRNHIMFWYRYFDKDHLLYETNFRLYNYEYNWVKKIIEKSNKFSIQEKIEYKDGTYIVVLKRIIDKKERSISE